MFTAAVLPVLALLVIWSVFLIGHAYRLNMARSGLVPRDTLGAVGILTAPFLHGDLDHLFNNSVALFVLGWCLQYFYPKAALRVTLAVWLLGGFGVWLTARPEHHIGASGIVYGFASFLFFSGVIRRQRTLMAVSLLMVFLYGSMVWGILPVMAWLSWESHLWGGIIGAAMAWSLRAVEPAHLPRPIVFEEEDALANGEGVPGTGSRAETEPPLPPPPGAWPNDRHTDSTLL